MKHKAYYIDKSSQDRLQEIVEDLNQGYFFSENAPAVISTDEFLIYHLAKYEEGEEPEELVEEISELSDLELAYERVMSSSQSLIESVKSVSLNDVDDYLKNGYQVYHIYSKNAVLVKYRIIEEKTENETPV